MYVYHISIQSSIEGHLGYFHVLVIVTNAAINIKVHTYSFMNMCFQISGRYPEEESLGNTVALFLIFWGTSILFSIEAAPTFIPSRVSFSLHPLQHLFLVKNSHSNRYEVVSHCDFDLHLPYSWWCWAFFHMSIAHLYVFLGKVSVQVLCPLFNWTVVVELYEFFMYFGR